MAVSGGYLGTQMRGRILGSIMQYRECMLRDVIPAFSNINERAERIAEEYYAQAANQPAGEYEDGDLGGAAEEAQDEGIAFYETMTSVRQTMLNLLAAGLFHLVEQQLAELCRDSAAFCDSPALPKETKLGVVSSWFADYFLLDLTRLNNWPLLDELRLLANTVKHAEIKQTQLLRERRPELFRSPASLELDKFLDDDDISYAKEHPDYGRRPVLQPLAGADLYVSENLLQTYSDGIEHFFKEIASHFEAHESDYFPVADTVVGQPKA